MRKTLKSISVFTALAVIANTAAFAAGYEHGDWPVKVDSEGLWTFETSAKSQATGICTAYYEADIKSQDEFGTGGSVFGTLIREHSEAMRTAYRSAYEGGPTQLSKKVTDMTWHFANSAQYGSFQDFKDSANMACERHAIDTGVINQSYLDAFNDKMTGALAGL